MELFNKSCPLAFPLSQLRGIKPLPKNWEAGKARGQDVCNKGILAKQLAVNTLEL